MRPADEKSFGLYRIVGNSLPPRHSSTQSLELTEFILRNEPAFEGCTKIWILNRLVDPDHQEKLVSLIRRHNQESIVIPFNARTHNEAFLDFSGIPEAYRLSPGDTSKQSSATKVQQLEWLIRHKSQALININFARNIALKAGRKRFRWTLPFDVGNMFSPAGWGDFSEALAKKPGALFAVVKMSRIHDIEDAINVPSNLNYGEEPQLAFRSDSTALFDERLRYGNLNKVELLKRLGVPGIWDTWPGTPWEQFDNDAGSERGRYCLAGFLHRLPSGAPSGTEQDNTTRWVARFKGVSSLSRQLDIDYAVEFRKRQSGWFMSGVPSQLDSAVKQRLRDAGDMALAERDISVLDKGKIAPSGNRQDYHSLAPYFHGRAQKDGATRAECVLGSPQSLEYDRTGMDRFCRRSNILAIAGTALNDPGMLQAASRLVRLWIVDPATRMNPNLNHAQRVDGELQGRSMGLLDVRDLWFLPQTIELLRAANVIEPAEVETVGLWCKALLDSVSASAQFTPLRNAKNNIATWSLATVVGLRFQCGQVDVAAAKLRDAPRLLVEQFGPLNMQPHEVKRTRPLHYSLFNLSGFAAITVLGWHLGMDLRSYRGAEGQNLESALTFASRNRDLFSDYAGNERRFDKWIDALSVIFGDSRDGRSSMTLMLDGDLGLPPLWPMLAPSRSQFWH